MIMNKLFKLKALTFFACAFLVSTIAMAQMTPGAKTIASPRDSVSGTVAGSVIKINYGSPSVKGRKIFGGLQPYGKNWRAGANAATTFETSKDIKIEGKTLPAGKYTLFATPGEKEWTIVFNSVTGQWGIKRDGSANDDPAKDVVVVTVNAMTTKELVERLVYKLDKKGFSLSWENTEVRVKIK
jgi:hypothetical protein